MFKSIITFVAAALILTACNSQDAANQNNQTNVTEQQQSQDSVDVNQALSENQESSDNQAPSDDTSNLELEQSGDSHSNASDEKWSALEEYETIVAQIGHEDYAFNKITDNDNKRIMLLEKDGVSKYKTIYVKNTGRLKIISLDGDKQIYNEVLAAN